MYFRRYTHYSVVKKEAFDCEPAGTLGFKLSVIIDCHAKKLDKFKLSKLLFFLEKSPKHMSQPVDCFFQIKPPPGEDLR